MWLIKESLSYHVNFMSLSSGLSIGSANSSYQCYLEHGVGAELGFFVWEVRTYINK